MTVSFVVVCSAEHWSDQRACEGS